MGVFGILRWDGGTEQCLTVERPWLGNRPNVSCIPIGNYLLQRDNFPRFGNAFEVMGVPGRSAILIHAANTIDDIEGCIGPGERLGCLNGKWAVFESGIALKRFMADHAGQDRLELHIRNDEHQGEL